MVINAIFFILGQMFPISSHILQDNIGKDAPSNPIRSFPYTSAHIRKLGKCVKNNRIPPIGTEKQRHHLTTLSTVHYLLHSILYSKHNLKFSMVDVSPQVCCPKLHENLLVGNKISLICCKVRIN
jgi:hypothetical protein